MCTLLLVKAKEKFTLALTSLGHPQPGSSQKQIAPQCLHQRQVIGGKVGQPGRVNSSLISEGRWEVPGGRKWGSCLVFTWLLPTPNFQLSLTEDYSIRLELWKFSRPFEYTRSDFYDQPVSIKREGEISGFRRLRCNQMWAPLRGR